MGEMIEVPEDLVRELIQELRGLREGALSRPGGPLEVCAALAETYGAQLFTAAEAIRHVNARPSRLRSALACQLPAMTARSLGRFLFRHEGQPIGRFVVRRVGEESAGVIWKVAMVEGG